MMNYEIFKEVVKEKFMDYYLPRWTNYIAYLKGTLEGRSLTVPDSFQAEKAWVNAHNKYVLETGVDPVETAKRMYRKYHI